MYHGIGGYITLCEDVLCSESVGCVPSTYQDIFLMIRTLNTFCKHHIIPKINPNIVITTNIIFNPDTKHPIHPKTTPIVF